jgi:hypothetical protein
VDMSGRNVSVRIHALQSLNKSLFECVDHHVFQMIQPLCRLQGLVNEKIQLGEREILALSCNKC